MNIYITLDYELFFGANSGSVDACIIEPTQALLNIVEPFQIKFTCFVDAGYLVRLEAQKAQFPQLEDDYRKVVSQLQQLTSMGHRAELHVHPHWEDSYFDGEKWIFDTSRYKLSDFSDTEVIDIVTRYNDVIRKITGDPTVAYRAGGWSAQPFSAIKKALEINDIQIDSSVFAKGYYVSENQTFDFRDVPQYTTRYKFSESLTKEDKNGTFTEIPISSMKVSPLFFWNFAFRKLQKNHKHVAFGDGSAISLTPKEKIRLLTQASHTVVSLDGYKSSLLLKAFEDYKKQTANDGNFVIIGHPKAFTPYSLEKTREFILSTSKNNTFKTFFDDKK